MLQITVDLFKIKPRVTCEHLDIQCVVSANTFRVYI